VLARQAAAAVGVRTCWPWETAATLPSARRRKVLRLQRGRSGAGGGVGRGHTVAAAAYSLFVYQFNRSIFLRDYSRLSWYPGKISPEKNDADKMPQEK